MSAADVRLARVYDIVTLTAYPRFERGLPALPLFGRRVRASGALLAAHG
jgi:serine/threonine-protein kinase HipA